MLTTEQVQHFYDEGYLAVNGLLVMEADIAPVIAEYDALLGELCAQWQQEGLLPRSYSELPFERRLVEVYRAGCRYEQAMDIALPNSEVRSDTAIHLGPAVFNLLRSPRLLAAVECLIGSEIYSNPIQHVRIKPPRAIVSGDDRNRARMGKTQWHQDSGVGLPEADSTRMVTCWVAITEATVENGCLQVLPRSHRAGVALHCSTQDQVGIPDALIPQEQAVPIPLQPGGVLFFHPMCKHGSLENHSDAFRWSFDLRYNPIGESTGRPHFPGFIAQSRRQPQLELQDHAAWVQLWHDARARLAGMNGEVLTHRWDSKDPLCA